MIRNDNANREVIITPSTDGARISLSNPRTLSFAPATRSRRQLRGFVIALSLFLPLTLHAASYTSADIIAGTNAARQEHGVGTLTTNAKLQSAANAKAHDMLAKQYFSHYGPNGQAPWEWFKQSGYAF